MIDHVTYHVEPGTLDRADLEAFLLALGLQEISASEEVPEGWRVRWFRPRWPRPSVTLHLVEGPPRDDTKWDQDLLSLGHFCVNGIGADRYAGLKHTRWCVRDSGSGRIWLRYANLRVEVRP